MIDEAIDDARFLLARARSRAEELRERVPALRDALSWRSASAAEFEAAFAEWVTAVERTVAEIGHWDAQLAARRGSAGAWP